MARWVRTRRPRQRALPARTPSGNAFRTIERDDADVIIAGGAEAAITPMGVGGFAAMRALSTRNADPEHACRPFDKDRDGFVVVEGVGILVLEEPRTCACPRRRHPGRNHRLRNERRRLPHHQHGAARRRLLARYEKCPAQRQAGVRRRGLCECACHVDPARRCAGDGGHQASLPGITRTSGNSW